MSSKMKAWLGKFPLLFTLLLSAAVLMLWVRSYVIADRYNRIVLYEQDDSVWMTLRYFNSSFGGLQVLWERTDPTDVPYSVAAVKRLVGRVRPGYSYVGNPRYPMTVRDSSEMSLLNTLGINFRFGRFDEVRGTVHRFEVTLPFWALFGLSIIYPAWRYVVGVIHRQHAERGGQPTCPRCGEIVPAGSSRCGCCDLAIAVVREA